jgi:SAM-dependent methyltransferase
MESGGAIPKLVAAAEGTVLELGPGVGNQLPRMDQSRILHVYGVEPNLAFIPALRDKAAECGMEGRYTIIPCGIEDTDILEKSGVLPGTVDTVLSTQVLCSAPKPELVVKDLYRMLRPGGKLIFWEHHYNHDLLSRIVQSEW